MFAFNHLEYLKNTETILSNIRLNTNSGDTKFSSHNTLFPNSINSNFSKYQKR